MSYCKEYIFLQNLDAIYSMIADNRPRAEIARFLNIKYDTLMSYFKKYKIDYKGNQHRTGFEHKESRKPLKLIFNNDITISNGQLRRRLIEEGIKEKRCECCGITSWNNKSIVFELHHVDGNHYNNALSNLQLLCPNCHSQTETFRRTKASLNREIKNLDITGILNDIKRVIIDEKENYSIKKIEKYCLSCKKELKNNRSKYCSYECFHKYNRKFNPSKEELIEIFDKLHSYSAVGKYYGVSDNAVKKRCKLLKIIDIIKSKKQ